ncbi:hypothetical protein MKC70_21895, partial [[Clostridium] innocuum]|nr:hypothetical protein [[Clostridium] innocuum]
MQYKIGKIAKIMGVTPEAIRHGSFTLKKVESLKYGLNKLFFCQIYSILYSYFKVLYGIIYIGR